MTTELSDAISDLSFQATEGYGSAIPAWGQVILFLAMAVWLFYRTLHQGWSWKVIGIALLSGACVSATVLGKFLPLLINGESTGYSRVTLLMSFGVVLGELTLWLAFTLMGFVLAGLGIRWLLRRHPKNTPA